MGDPRSWSDEPEAMAAALAEHGATPLPDPAHRVARRARGPAGRVQRRCRSRRRRDRLSPWPSPPRKPISPLIISVDDHVLEPKDLWQRELPEPHARAGPQGGHARRSSSSSRAATTASAATTPTAQWCDLWLFDDLVVPTGLLHAPAGMPRDEQRNVPAIYEDFRPGTYDQKARLADMTSNHVEAAINYPNTFPRFAGQGFAERDDKDLALACLRIYNDWMIDEWCGGDAPRPPHPADARAAVGSGAGGRRGPALRGEGQLRDRLHREPVQARLARRCTPASGTCSGATCAETDTTVSMHIGSSSSMPTTSTDAPLATSMSLYAQNAQGSLCDWVFSGTLAAVPGPEDRLRREPGRLDAVPARAHGRRLGRRPGRRRRRRSLPSEQVQGPGLRLHLRRPARPQGPRRRRPRARSCSRPTTRTPTAPSRTPGRSPTACSPRPAWTPTSATPCCAATPSRPTASHRFGITE